MRIMAGNSLNHLKGINASTEGGGAYNSLSAGRKAYGGGRPYPNSGKVGAAGKTGYSERDARRRAIMMRQQGGR